MKLQPFHFCKADESLKEAILKIDQNAIQIVFVINDKKQLIGTISDGDIRRALLKGIAMDQPVSTMMNSQPKSVYEDEIQKFELLKMMVAKTLRQMPILNRQNEIVDILLLNDLLKTPSHSPSVVILAGGKGQRLMPLTEDVPKPLLKIGGRAILDILVEQFVGQGFKNIFVAVNYKAEQVKDFLGDGQRYGAEIKYLHESTPLGTAGPLSQLNSQALREPVIVMNGDLLTNINFYSMMNFHQLHDFHFTMGVKDYEFQVPYGVVSVNEEQIIETLDEKPTHKFFVNAGIYVISPELIGLIPKAEGMDMPELLKLAKKKNFKVGAFPIREYWLDIGKMDDYQQAQSDYEKYFNS